LLDAANNRVVKLAAGSGAQTVLPFIGRHGFSGVAVDRMGALYVADAANNRVFKLSQR
jgi:serine/threonine-protein kinase